MPEHLPAPLHPSLFPLSPFPLAGTHNAVAGKRLALSACPASCVDPPTHVNHRLRSIPGTEDTEAPARGRFGCQDSSPGQRTPRVCVHPQPRTARHQSLPGSLD